MWQLKRWLWQKPREPEPELTWYDPGPQNPFGVRLLDCRAVAWNLVATTADRTIAERYVVLRESDGRQLIDAAIPDSVRVPTSLTFPHDGANLEGIVFKADSMEVKWDIYIYNSVFLFARSWTGDLCYRALAKVSETDIQISEIECSRSATELAASHVYFLIATHAMGRVLPHRVPADTPRDPRAIAALSFSLFGKLGCYATFEDVTRIPIGRLSMP